MNDDTMTSEHNPDVLSCLANLSNDEVFTPPAVVNQMLDMLPQKLFRNPDTTFLDPACKTGVFLREIAKRLIHGLEKKIPDLQERVDHIFQKQLFGIAITEMTGLLSRRGVYCSKFPNKKFSVTRFRNAEGNIRFRNVNHSWENGRCKFCGISQETILGDDERGETLEAHAYEWIHTLNPEEIFKMKFDVIISNPPYQLNDGGHGASASPIYQKFVEQAMKLRPRYLTMITPSRYLAGGKGLDSFRESMLSDTHITKMVDFINAKDCFPENSISGGVNYFLWERDADGECEFTTITSNSPNTMRRRLNEFPTFVRYNQAISIIHKVQAEKKNFLSSIVSSRNPYGLPTSFRGVENRINDKDFIVFSSKGTGYITDTGSIVSQYPTNNYRIMLSRITYEHAGEPDKDGMLRVLSRIKVLRPRELCTDSYLIIGGYDDEKRAKNLHLYLQTKFVRFLISQTLTAINLSKDKFSFVPIQDFSKPWTNEKLYKKYGLTEEEIAFIDSMIRPMDLEGGDEDAD